MCDLLEHNPWLYNTHQSRVKNFLKSKHLSSVTIDYDHVDLYSRVMAIKDSDIVDPKHRRQFNKFCRQWVRTHGVLGQDYIQKISNRTKYYENKQWNAMMRERRLARKQKKTV